MAKFEIFKLGLEKEEKIVDVVTEEIPLTITVNDTELVTLLASPTDLKELAVGFLFTSGFITRFTDIQQITLDDTRWLLTIKLKEKKIDERLIHKRMFTSGCGRGTIFYNAVDIMHRNKKRLNLNLDRKNILRMMKEFQENSPGFIETGGVHSAAIANEEKILVIREDIGRHNAVDKVIGFTLMNQMDLKNKILFSSGRISSDVIFKIQKTIMPAIISRSAPTDQACKHARAAGIILIGFARGQRMNVYNGREHIV
ncbi:formate dehydrogenase accessory sulfurtransferase FdhD [candidate division KSB1 bacterium]|nr:formate dehydrogenase accessory sulfurtransferase FdhD [candidate division KSB1 bacterium]